MNLIPWRNKRRETELTRTTSDWPAAALRTELDRLFDRFLQEMGGATEGLLPALGEGLTGGLGTWTPALEVTEGHKDITIRAELPGVSAKDVNVEICGNVLTLSGEKRETREERTGPMYRSERRFGRFQRSIELPASADPSKVTAEHANGVLTITIQRNPAAAAKRVPVTGK
jgi:HSP20 family protein